MQDVRLLLKPEYHEQLDLESFAENLQMRCGAVVEVDLGKQSIIATSCTAERIYHLRRILMEGDADEYFTIT